MIGDIIGWYLLIACLLMTVMTIVQACTDHRPNPERRQQKFQIFGFIVLCPLTVPYCICSYLFLEYDRFKDIQRIK